MTASPCWFDSAAVVDGPVIAADMRRGLSVDPFSTEILSSAPYPDKTCRIQVVR